MRTTKDLDIALDRIMVLLGGTAEKAGHNRRRIQFDRMTYGPVDLVGTPARCLYVAALTLTEAPSLGGFGRSIEEVRDAVRLRQAAIPTQKIVPHERNFLQALCVDGRGT